MKKIKTAALLTALAMCVCMLAACGGAGTQAQSGTAAEAETPAHEEGLFVDGKQVEVDAVLTIDGTDIGFDEYRYYYLSTRSRFDGGDVTLWRDASSAESADVLKQYVLESIESMAAFEQMAADNNITLTDAEIKSIDDSIAVAKESLGSDEEYADALKEMYFTPQLYKSMLEQNMLASKVLKQLYGDEIKADINANYIRARQILIKFDADAETAQSSTSESQSASAAQGKTQAQAKAEADEVLQKITDGEDFEKMLAAYNEDAGQTADGYYFTSGQMTAEFYNAAAALANDEISAVVTSSDGCHIIKRLALDDEYVEENMLSMMSTELSDKIDADVKAAMAKQTVTFSTAYDDIAPDTMF